MVVGSYVFLVSSNIRAQMQVDTLFHLGVLALSSMNRTEAAYVCVCKRLTVCLNFGGMIKETNRYQVAKPPPTV